MRRCIHPLPINNAPLLKTWSDKKKNVRLTSNCLRLRNSRCHCCAFSDVDMINIDSRSGFRVGRGGVGWGIVDDDKGAVTKSAVTLYANFIHFGFNELISVWTNRGNYSNWGDWQEQGRGRGRGCSEWAEGRGVGICVCVFVYVGTRVVGRVGSQSLPSR